MWKWVVGVIFIVFGLWVAYKWDMLALIYEIETTQCPTVEDDEDFTLPNSTFSNMPKEDLEVAVEALVANFAMMAESMGNDEASLCFNDAISEANRNRTYLLFYSSFAACPHLDVNKTTLTVAYVLCGFPELPGFTQMIE